MFALKVAGLALIAAGILRLTYGRFTRPRKTRQATVGPAELSVEHRRIANVPVWAGVGAIVIGSAQRAFVARRAKQGPRAIGRPWQAIAS